MTLASISIRLASNGHCQPGTSDHSRSNNPFTYDLRVCLTFGTHNSIFVCKHFRMCVSSAP